MNRTCKASEMYTPSALFRKAYAYATSHYDSVAMLSAKYGLLLPDEVITPYDLTLDSMSDKEQMAWAERVLSQLQTKLPLTEISTVAFHCGLTYRKYLAGLLKRKNIGCTVPLEGLTFGKQMAWYARET